jgi:IS30 family transposase
MSTGECNTIGLYSSEETMKRRRRFSYEQLRTLWTLWQDGHTLPQIQTALGVSLSGVVRVVQARGGLPPRARTRARAALSLRERELIADGLAAQESRRGIARRLGRAPSTISREILRNGARTPTTRTYHPATADGRAWTRAARPKPRKLTTHRALCRVVAAKLEADWSPRQIARWLVKTHPTEPTMHVAAETIYRTLYVQTKATLRAELVAHLRRGQRRRRPLQQQPRAGGRIPNAVSIAARPPESDDRRVPGHWEGDLLAGANNSYIATLVERASRYVLLVKVRGKDTRTVTRALARRINRLPARLKASLTWDRGSELAAHARFTLATDVRVYFCDPHSPWQRGTNENTNGLLRQYFPKGMDLTAVTQRQLNAVELRLNTRPRETLGFETPAFVYNAFLRDHPVASTG